MGRDDIFFERDAREGLRAARELSRCVMPRGYPGKFPVTIIFKSEPGIV